MKLGTKCWSKTHSNHWRRNTNPAAGLVKSVEEGGHGDIKEDKQQQGRGGPELKKKQEMHG
jgi:hypothetical protein